MLSMSAGRVGSRWLRASLLAGLFAFVVVPGCGGEDEPAEPPVPSLATVYCAAQDACCATDGRTNDGPRCRADVASQLDPKKLGTPEAAACEALLRARTADGTYCERSTYENGVYVCSGIFRTGDTVPSVPVGAVCKVGRDCLSPSPEVDAICVPSSWSGLLNPPPIPSICIEVRGGALGEGPCVRTRTGDDLTYLSPSQLSPPPLQALACDRGDGVYCERQTKTCRPTVAAGEPCEVDEQCASPDLACLYRPGQPSYLCVPRRALGASCGPDDRCVFGAGCESGACVRKKRFAESCRQGSECDSGICVQGYFCSGPGDGRVHGCYD